MPTPSNSNSFTSSLLRFWRNSILHTSNDKRSTRKPLFAADASPPRGLKLRGKHHKAERGHKRNRHSTVSDNPPPSLPPEVEKASLNDFAQAFRRQMEHLSHLPPTPPCHMETILETSEGSEGSVVEAGECDCESVYHTPTALEFDFSDIPHFLNFIPDIGTHAKEPLTNETPSLHGEILSLREELEEVKRENQDLNAELAECYDYGRSLRELEIRYEQLLEEVKESNKTRRMLTQNMSLITDDLRNAKHSQMWLEREADQLRWIIHHYQASVGEMGIALPYQDEIDKHVSSLDYPIQPPPIASSHAWDAEELPPVTQSSEDTGASLISSLQKGNYIATPPRTPNLRRVKSPKAGVFHHSVHKLSGSESPVRRDYIPREGSPLKFDSRLWSSDDEDLDKRRLRTEVSVDGRTSRLYYAEDSLVG